MKSVGAHRKFPAIAQRPEEDSTSSAFSASWKNRCRSASVSNCSGPDLRYGRRLWFAEVEGTAANAQRRTNPELLETPTAGYATVNVKAGWHAKQTTITLGLDNALNRFYDESLSYQRDPFRNGTRVPEPGRTLFVSVNYHFTTP